MSGNTEVGEPPPPPPSTTDTADLIYPPPTLHISLSTPLVFASNSDKLYSNVNNHKNVARRALILYPAEPASQLLISSVSRPFFEVEILTISRPPTLITVHPSVVASILTHHARRPADSTAPRVIGTLLGVRSENGQEIDVRSSFAVPHSEGEEQVALDMPFQQGMMELLAKNGIKESIVGWYATHPDLNAYSALIQNYFSQETGAAQAIHLTVDTELDPSGKKGLGIKGWVSTSLGLNPKPENCVFLPVPVVIKYAESERAGRE